MAPGTASHDTSAIICMVAEPESSTPLVPKPATGHDPEPVPTTSHPHNIFP
jgi:hypothetical protein